MQALAANIDGPWTALAANIDGPCNALAANVDGLCNALAANIDGPCNALAANIDGPCNALAANIDGPCNISSFVIGLSLEKCNSDTINIYRSRKRNPQKLTQLISESQPRHLMGKRTAQKDTIIDITSDSQVNSNFPYRWSPASLTFNNYCYLFLYLYIT